MPEAPSFTSFPDLAAPQRHKIIKAPRSRPGERNHDTIHTSDTASDHDSGSTREKGHIGGQREVDRKERKRKVRGSTKLGPEARSNRRRADDWGSEDGTAPTEQVSNV
jgi:hypothetical protein